MPLVNDTHQTSSYAKTNPNPRKAKSKPRVPMRNPRVPTKSRGKDPEDILYNDIKKSMNTGNRKGERVGVYGAVMSQVYPPRKSVRGLPERGVSRSRSAVSGKLVDDRGDRTTNTSSHCPQNLEVFGNNKENLTFTPKINKTSKLIDRLKCDGISRQKR